MNRTIIMASAIWTFEQHQPFLLHEHGGPAEFDRKWAELLIRRTGWAKRKAISAARNAPDVLDLAITDFELCSMYHSSREHPTNLLISCIKWLQF